MLTRPQTAINLPLTRATQLREIAAAAGLTVSQYVDAHIRREWQRLERNHELPSWEFAAGPDPDTGRPIVAIAGPGALAPVFLSAADAARLSRELLALAKGDGPTAIHVGGIRVKRIGMGLSYVATPDGVEDHHTSMTPSIAADVARLLAKGAREARDKAAAAA